MDKLYIDLTKGGLNTAKLVKRMVQVKGHNGKTFSRMQWVDPNTDQPAFHSRHMTDEERMQHHMKVKNREEVDPPENLKAFHSRLGLRHTNHGLQDHVVEHRHGTTGSLDLSALTQGTPLHADDKAIKYSHNLMSQHPSTKSHMDKVDAKDHISSVFKNVTKEGLESVFSDPKGKYNAELVQMSVGPNNKHGYIECCIDLEWYDKKGDYIGFTSRTVHRDKNGHLHVYNDITQIETKHQGKGVGRDEQERSEQFWRYLSDGHPVHLSLLSNINVGVYAWALKGYDFESENADFLARHELKHFLKQNNMDIDETLHKCGYNSIDDLKHAWQFSSLNTGQIYDASDIIPKNKLDDEIKRKTKKGVTLGKAFMLGGKTAWDGEKILNGGTEHEEISELFKKKKSTKKVG